MEGEELKRREPRIPGYRIEGVLGRGATGTVYRARQISVDREVALKVLHPDLVGAKGAEHRLQREARATARLAHPHIISAFDMGVVDGMWWYAMELVDGVSLLEKIRERPLSEREALRLFIPLVEALQHAFERRVVHRDIKPANILLERGGRALIVDLGLAFADDDPSLTKSGATLGTPHYISPEQARDPSGADTQSDLWSLGATLYHAVCGRPPFAGDSVAEILSAVLYEPVPDPRIFAPALSSGFVLVLRKCLARDRSKRYATPAELLADLERLRERRAPAVKRGSLEPLASRGRRFVPIAASILVVLAVAGAMGWLLTRGSDPRLDAASAEKAGSTGADARLAEIESALSGPALGLAGALERADVLTRLRVLDDRESQRLPVWRAELEKRVRDEIEAYRREVEARLAQLVMEGRFDAAATEAKAGLLSGLRARIGAGKLPEDLQASFDAWVSAQETSVRQARTAATRALGEAYVNQLERSILPRVLDLRRAGEWQQARALLTTDARAWIDAVPARRVGLTGAEIDEAVARFSDERLTPARAELDEAWKQVDARFLEFVGARVQTLRSELEARAIVDAAERLREDVLAEVVKLPLKLDAMPNGLLHLGREAFVKGTDELEELEQRLALDDARKGLAELEAAQEGIWRSRHYEDAAEAYQSALTTPWLGPVKTTLELRVREAHLLQELLERAARAVSARVKQRLEVRVGSILVSGPVSQAGEPLRSGFVITLDSGLAYGFSLRAGAGPTTPSTPVVVGSDALLQLAGISADDAGTPAADRLVRALFLLREGETTRAHSVVNGGPLPVDDALVLDLEERLRVDRARVQEIEGERRAGALERLRLVRREARTGSGDAGDAFVRRIESLLAESAAVLTEDEVRELRRLRDDWYAQNRKSAADPSVASVFAPTAIEDLSSTRVRLKYVFDTPRAGAFEPGSWIPEGIGWSAVGYARSDEDMLSRPAPTLALRDPLRIQTDPLDVRLRFDQRPETPPDLVVVTLAGFHLVFAFSSDGTRGRCVVDSGDVARVVARARRGEGREMPGWKSSGAIELHILLRRGSGALLVDVDGKRVDEFQRPVPREDVTHAVLQVRSWQPMRLLSATIEAAHK